MDNTPYFQDIRQARQMGSNYNNTIQSNTHRSLSPSNRRNSTTALAFEARSFSRDSSPQPNRRFSNPTNQTSYASTNSASYSRSRSPSDPQYCGANPTPMRRFSQPAVYYSPNVQEGEEKRSLAMQEKESYSSLTYLPEVRAYLKFMEEDNKLPNRSKSFNGRNSSRRSSFNRRKRSKSRTRTPTPTPFDMEDGEQNVFESFEGSNKAYGRFLTPQRSLEPTANRANSFDVNEISARFNQQQQQQEEPMPNHNEMFPRRRSGSIIRTTFI